MQAPPSTSPTFLCLAFSTSPRWIFVAMGAPQMSSPQHGHLASPPGFGRATTGACRSGKGGVFLSLWSMVSKVRTAHLPSNFTSIDPITNSAFPLVLLEAIPPTLPASSPVDVLKFESLVQTGFPSTVIDL